MSKPVIFAVSAATMMISNAYLSPYFDSTMPETELLKLISGVALGLFLAPAQEGK